MARPGDRAPQSSPGSPRLSGMARSGDRAPQSSPGSPRLSGMARPGDRAPQSSPGSPRLSGDGPVRGPGPAGSLPKVPEAAEDGSSPTASAMREAREEKNVPASTHQVSSAALMNGVHSRKDQKVFFSFPRKGDAAALSGKAAKGCAVDRARPAKVSREAARGPSGGFSLFLRSEKEGPPPEPSEAGPVGRGGARERAQFSPQGGNGA